MKLVNIELNRTELEILGEELRKLNRKLNWCNGDLNVLYAIVMNGLALKCEITLDTLKKYYKITYNSLIELNEVIIIDLINNIIDNSEVTKENKMNELNNASYREFINGLIIGISDYFKEYILEKKGFVRYVDLIDKIHDRLNKSIPMYINGELNDKHMSVYSAIYESVITDNRLCFYNGTYEMPNGKNTTFKSLFIGNRRYREILKKC